MWIKFIKKTPVHKKGNIGFVDEELGKAIIKKGDAIQVSGPDGKAIKKSAKKSKK